MTVPNDPLDALKWAWEHSDRAWWLIIAIGAGIAWTRKRMSDWSRRNALTVGPANARRAGWTAGAPSPAAQTAASSAAPPAAAPAQPGTASAYTAATAYAASAYAAQAVYAPPPPAAPAPHVGAGRKLHRDAPPAQRSAAPAQRAVTPVARSVDVPVASGAWTLAGAFGDPAHARTAIVIAEVLGPPPGLR